MKVYHSSVLTFKNSLKTTAKTGCSTPAHMLKRQPMAIKCHSGEFSFNNLLMEKCVRISSVSSFTRLCCNKQKLYHRIITTVWEIVSFKNLNYLGYHQRPKYRMLSMFCMRFVYNN